MLPVKPLSSWHCLRRCDHRDAHRDDFRQISHSCKSHALHFNLFGLPYAPLLEPEIASTLLFTMNPLEFTEESYGMFRCGHDPRSHHVYKRIAKRGKTDHQQMIPRGTLDVTLSLAMAKRTHVSQHELESHELTDSSCSLSFVFHSWYDSHSMRSYCALETSQNHDELLRIV